MKLPKKKKISYILRKWHDEKRIQTLKYIKEHTEYILKLIYNSYDKTIRFGFNTVDAYRIGIKYIAMQYGLKTKISKEEFPDFNNGNHYNLIVSKQ